MTTDLARDLLVLMGLGCTVAGTWLIAGLPVALLVLGVVLLTTGLAAEMRAGDE